ncbi:hypothetical protein [Nocardia sp. IFM 10818]
MTLDSRARALLLAVVAAALIGLIDAATARTWDLVAIFAAILALGGLAAARLGGRRTVSLRADLARWLTLRAAEGGEPTGRLADRAVAAYRAGLTGGPDEGEIS